MTVQSIVGAHVRLTALGAILLLGVAGCRDERSPTAPLPLLSQATSAPVVNSLADPGDGTCDDEGAGDGCTLREAIALAPSSGATITFAPGLKGTIELGSLLSIGNKGTLTIEGPGADDLTIKGDGTHSVFEIVGGTTTLSDMTITGGNRASTSYGGGGIYHWTGTLSVVRATITGNTAGGSGGGIYSYSGDLSIIGSTISGNSAYGGAGVFFQAGGTLVLTESTVENNTATGSGGGVVAMSATQAHLTDCLFTANTSESSGAGISVNSTPLRVERCTFTGNIANADISAGAGIDFVGGDKLATVVNSTFSGNTAWRGPAIHNYSGTMKISHSTFTGNTSTGERGMGFGVGAVLANDPTEVKNSIIWGNPGGDVSVEGFDNYPYTSLGYNLVGADGENVTLTSVFDQTGDQTGVTDAKLGTLQLNSPGTTPTHALLDESPAIDAGVCTDAGGGTVATDQRGVSRPQGDACDIGAYEVGGAVASTLVVNSLADPGDGTCDDTECTLREAIAYAESGATITFVPGLTGTITATNEVWLIEKNLTIAGPGATVLALRASGKGLLQIASGVTAAEISGLTLRDAGPKFPAVLNDGILTIRECVVTNNHLSESSYAPGLSNSGTLTIIASTISDNSLTTESYSTCGGAIRNVGTLTVTGSTISGNERSGGYAADGGGICNGAPFAPGTATLTNSTVSGNTASGVGGGIHNHYESTLTLINSTVTGNKAVTGGGINQAGTMTLTNTLLAGNTTDYEGNGPDLWINPYTDPTPTSIISYSLIGSASGNSIVNGTNGNIVGVATADLRLGALEDNGGATWTHALLEESPAIDAGTATGCPATDQCGVTRPQGGACDIGAYEGGTVTTADELDVSVDASTSITRTYVWEISKGPDATYRGFPGASWDHTYEIEVEQNKDEEAPSYTDARSVSGTITIENNTLKAATIESVTDVVSTDIEATVDCGDEVTFPYTLATGASLLCSYASDLPDGTARTNTATVTTSGDVAGDEATSDVDFAEAAIVNGNPTVHVTDDYATPDNVVDDKKSDALGDGGGFEYAYTFACPTDLSQYTEGVYTDTIVNTATIDEYSTVADDATVTVTCYVLAKAKVVETTTDGDENIGQSPFTFALYAPDFPPGYGYAPVETVTLDAAGEVLFTTELKDEGTWTVVEVLPAGWVRPTDVTCSFVVDYPPLYKDGNASAAGQTLTCNFANVEKSRMDLRKLTGGLVNPGMSWTFEIYEGLDGFGGTKVAGDNTAGDNDGLLDFGFVDLDPSATYTICELEVAAGYSTFWRIDTDGDGIGDVTVIPYNPNQDDDPPEDLGNRCVDIGAGTGISLPPGATLHFVVNNAQPGGAPRSNGYWKNWNGCTGGGQATTAEANGGWPEGFWLLEDVLTPGIGGGVTWDDIHADGFVFPITSCPVAVDVLDKRKVKNPTVVADGKKQASDPLFNLAAHLLAAQLNFGAGACTTDEVQGWVLEAETLLDTYNFDGNDHDNLGKKDDNAARANELAAFLDSYNTGMICGNGGD